MSRHQKGCDLEENIVYILVPNRTGGILQVIERLPHVTYLLSYRSKSRCASLWHASHYLLKWEQD